MLVAEAALGVGAGAAGLDPDIGPGDQLFKHLLASLAAGVEGEGVHVAVILGIAVVAAGLAGHGGRFHLDDLGAHFRHHAGRVGAGNIGPRHENLHAGKNAELGELAKGQMIAIVIFIVGRHTASSFPIVDPYIFSQPASTLISAPEM